MENLLSVGELGVGQEVGSVRTLTTPGLHLSVLAGELLDKLTDLSILAGELPVEITDLSVLLGELLAELTDLSVLLRRVCLDSALLNLPEK